MTTQQCLASSIIGSDYAVMTDYFPQTIFPKSMSTTRQFNWAPVAGPERIVLPFGNRKRPKWLRRHRRMLRNGCFVVGVNDGLISYGRKWHDEVIVETERQPFYYLGTICMHCSTRTESNPWPMDEHVYLRGVMAYETVVCAACRDKQDHERNIMALRRIGRH